VGWSPPIPLNFEGQKTRSMENPGAKISKARPYRLVLKYPYYKKDADVDAHVRVFNVDVKANGETSKEYIITTFNYTLKEMSSYWCHKYMLKFHDYNFFELIQTFYKCH